MGILDFLAIVEAIERPLRMSTTLYSCRSCKISTILPQTLPIFADDFEFADASLAPRACPPNRRLVAAVIAALRTIIEIACDLGPSLHVADCWNCDMLSSVLPRCQPCLCMVCSLLMS